MTRLRGRPEWQLFTVLTRADRRLGLAWWAVLVARGLLPAGFAIATGALVAAVQSGRGLTGPLAGAWLATPWLLRESGVWKDRRTAEVRAAQRDSDYAYRLAVDPPAAKELRLFGLAGWTIERFIARRIRLHELQYRATRLREKSVLWSLLLVVGANVLVVWMLATASDRGL